MGAECYIYFLKLPKCIKITIKNFSVSKLASFNNQKKKIMKT